MEKSQKDLQLRMAVEGKDITERKWYPWFICAMSFIVQFVGMSFHGSFGPLYVKMLRHFQERDTKTGNTCDSHTCLERHHGNKLNIK